MAGRSGTSRSPATRPQTVHRIDINMVRKADMHSALRIGRSGLLWSLSLACAAAPKPTAAPAARPAAAQPAAELPAQEPKPADFERSAASAHARYHWNPSSTSAGEVDNVMQRAELAFAKVSALLGADRTPRERLIILMAGDALAEGYSRPARVPHVTEAGQIVLYRYPGQGGGYESSLAHEMVHAFRTPDPRRRETFKGGDGDDGDAFFEEGFAELIATRSGIPKQGFPTYGYPLDVVVGQWIARGQAIGIDVLMKHHEELNLRCLLQTYSIRSSFFAYLDEKYGLPRVMRLAYLEAEITPRAYEQIFGAPLDQLTSAWSAWASTRFAAIADGPEQGRRYREQTPARYMPVCDPHGIDQEG
jgi:hypothetical protein